MQLQSRSTDVVVVGGAGAACRAAVEAAVCGAKVIMIVKGSIGTSGATTYGVSESAGYNVGDGHVDPTDSPDEHYRDILAAGLNTADPTLARVLADEAGETLAFLDNLGLPVEKDGDRYVQFQACFSSKPRTHIIKGHGAPIVKTLQRVIGDMDIQVLEHTMVANLFRDADGVNGVGCLTETGEYFVIHAKAVVLATGGAGQLFAANLNPCDITGDGYVLGFDAGADLNNMEFMQIGVAIVAPVVNLLGSWVWSAMPTLRNAKGEEFLPQYLPDGVSAEQCFMDKAKHFPFSCRDHSRYIEIGIHSEVLKGSGTAAGGVYLDLTKVNQSSSPQAGFQKMWPITRAWLLERGLDTETQPVEIACVAQAVNGGLAVNAGSETTVPGLFAAGEVIGGPSGADRLGGDMFPTCQVFGRRAGRSAAEYASSQRGRPIASDTIRSMERHITTTAKAAVGRTQLHELQRIMDEGLFLQRSGADLQRCLEKIAGLQRLLEDSPASGPPSFLPLEFRNLLTVGKIMCRAALVREESRGSHFRTDYPTRNDDKWAKSLFLKKDGIDLALSFKSYR